MTEADVHHWRSAGGVVYHDGNVLTFHIRKADEIVFPKGTIKPEETPEEATVHEVLEETGYHVRITAPLSEVVYEFTDDDGTHYTKKVYLYLLERIDENEPPAPRHEAHEIDEGMEALWLPAREARKRLTHADSRRCTGAIKGKLGDAHLLVHHKDCWPIIIFPCCNYITISGIHGTLIV